MAKKNLSTEKELTSEEKMVNGISSFFIKNRKLLIILAVVVVVALVGGIIAVTAVNSARAPAMEKVADLEDRYNAALASDTPEWDAITAELKELVGGSSYPSVKAAYLLGLVSYEREDYAAAQSYFEQMYDLNSKTFMAPLALVNAAAAADAQGNTETAVTLYNQVYNDYPESGVAPRALFNVARIYLSQGNTQLAQATFAQVADYYPNSEYGKLAKNLANVL